MSRIGKKPIELPAGVDFAVSNNNVVTVSGKLGKLEQQVSKLLKVELVDGKIYVTALNNSREANAAHGLYRTLIANMVEGVTNGFTKNLIINGVGYKVFDRNGAIEFKIGYSHPVIFNAPEGITLSCPSQTEIKVFGYDKQKVGQVAATIRDIQKVEPYHAYGIRYADEVVVKKEGKTAAKK